MLKLTTCLFLVITSTLIFNTVAKAQTCIQGDCKKGYGIQRIYTSTSTDYFIGNFNRKEKLEGKGYLLKGIRKAINETSLFTAFSKENPPIENLLDLNADVIQSGNFVEGVLEGPGVMILSKLDYYPGIKWIPIDLFGKKDISYMKYEGIFSQLKIAKSNTLTDFFTSYNVMFDQSKPSEAGKITFYYPNDTLICVSDNLVQSVGNSNSLRIYKSDMVVDIRRKGGLGNELIRSTFLNRKQHGWALVHKKNWGGKEAKFFRQLWCYGEMLYEDNGGSYPFDIDNSQTITTANGNIVTGPMINGKVNGFGTITFKDHIEGYRLGFNTNNQYAGYIKDNLPDGYGLMDTIGSERYGMFNAGYFQQGNRVTYNIRLTIEQVHIDYSKNEFIKSRTYESMYDYLNGRIPSFGFEGNKIPGIGWHGLVKNFNLSTINETWYDNGKKISSAAYINHIMACEVYVKDGIASMVVSYNPSTGEATLSDGRKINASNKNEYKPSSKYNSSHFYSICPCGGEGKTTTSAEVSGYTNSWTRTEQVNKSAVVGYWQGTQQVTSTYYTPGYTITRKVACTNPKAVWAPYGVGTRHSVLTVNSLQE